MEVVDGPPTDQTDRKPYQAGAGQPNKGRHGPRKLNDRHGPRKANDRHGPRKLNDRHGPRKLNDRHGPRKANDRHGPRKGTVRRIFGEQLQPRNDRARRGSNVEGQKPKRKMGQDRAKLRHNPHDQRNKYSNDVKVLQQNRRVEQRKSRQDHKEVRKGHRNDEKETRSDDNQETTKSDQPLKVGENDDYWLLGNLRVVKVKKRQENYEVYFKSLHENWSIPAIVGYCLKHEHPIPNHFQDYHQQMMENTKITTKRKMDDPISYLSKVLDEKKLILAFKLLILEAASQLFIHPTKIQICRKQNPIRSSRFIKQLKTRHFKQTQINEVLSIIDMHGWNLTLFQKKSELSVFYKPELNATRSVRPGRRSRLRLLTDEKAEIVHRFPDNENLDIRVLHTIEPQTKWSIKSESGINIWQVAEGVFRLMPMPKEQHSCIDCSFVRLADKLVVKPKYR